MKKFNFKNRIQSNPRLLRLKNPTTGEIIDYEIQDLQESEIVENGTEMTAEVLNTMQSNIEESCVIVSPTQPETNERVWIQKGKNLFNSNLIIGLANCTNNNGTIKQNEADTNSNLNWKVQTFKDGVFVLNPIVFKKNDIGKISLTFIKLSTFNEVGIGLNGSKIDTLVTFNASKLIDGETYTISFEITNVTQGSVSWKDIQIEQGSTATEYEEYIEKKIYCRNDNGVYEEFIPKPEPINIITGVEFETGRIIDDKKEYGKRYNIGSIESGKTVTKTHGLSVSNITGAEVVGYSNIAGATFINTGNNFGLTFAAIDMYISNNIGHNILNCYVTVYYTKTT